MVVWSVSRDVLYAGAGASNLLYVGPHASAVGDATSRAERTAFNAATAAGEQARASEAAEAASQASVDLILRPANNSRIR